MLTGLNSSSGDERRHTSTSPGSRQRQYPYGDGGRVTNPSRRPSADSWGRLVDRAKDLIIVSGFNVFPAEVEEVLLEHPGIETAAVVGVPHPHTGEAVKAYVVVACGSACEEDEIIAFCAERLARYKCPDKVAFVDEIPVGLAGKVLRRSLR